LKVITFNEVRALDLYYELKNDAEIGLEVEATSNAIACWRKRKRLPCIATNSNNVGIHYKKVLTETQAKEMHSFLVALNKGATLCKQAGVKPDIHAAMFAWGNIQMSAAEKGTTQGFINRENQEKELMNK